MNRKAQIRRQLEDVRARTLWLLDKVPDEFLRRRIHSFYSPIGWHFGHVGRTEEHWILCEALGEPPSDDRLAFLYADTPDNPKDNRVNIPDRAGTMGYLERTRKRTLCALEACDLDSTDPFLADGYAFEFALQHECQHQETIAEMLCLIHQSMGASEIEPHPWRSSLQNRFIDVNGGTFQMGSDDPHGYDNEKTMHTVHVEPFRIAETAVTAYQWTEFMGDGGYENESLWSPEGWSWKNAEQASMPEYWVRGANGGWAMYGPRGIRPLNPDEPAASISHFEAAAFASWAGKRLPTEAEWEFVAGGAQGTRFPWGDTAPTPEVARFGLECFSPRNVDDPTSSQPANLAGNIWEWTSSTFLPYPGFQAFPYDGYSKDHMQGEHRVCRGGSWATAGPILRRTFRNWYVPSYRQGFLGVRLAA
jgi:iron(II)-dependent oxidoreductase